MVFSKDKLKLYIQIDSESAEEMNFFFFIY